MSYYNEHKNYNHKMDKALLACKDIKSAFGKLTHTDIKTVATTYDVVDWELDRLLLERDLL